MQIAVDAPTRGGAEAIRAMLVAEGGNSPVAAAAVLTDDAAARRVAGRVAIADGLARVRGYADTLHMTVRSLVRIEEADEDTILGQLMADRAVRTAGDSMVTVKVALRTEFELNPVR